jgi:hypothetical protein
MFGLTTFVGTDLHDGQQQIVHTPETKHAFEWEGSIIMFIFSMSKELPLVG